MARTRAPLPDLLFEQQLAACHGGVVAGIDEAGRGPWAGPVVAAAVIWPDGLELPGVADSKQLRPAARAALAQVIEAATLHGIGSASVAEIDTHNILRATELAMARALEAMLARAAARGVRPGGVLVDGNWRPRLPLPVTTVVGGDARCRSIAAASILAKETRDRIMAELDAACPGYGWASNKGYGTPAHAAALARLGPSPHHRRSFRPVATAAQAWSDRATTAG